MEAIATPDYIPNPRSETASATVIDSRIYAWLNKLLESESIPSVSQFSPKSPSAFYPLIPSPSYSCAYEGMPDFPSIGEQRRDNDVSSVASSAHTASTSLASRPILSPTPPSTKRRSPSPTRKQMMQLGQATPPVIFFQPGKENPQPEPVVELRTRLSKGLRKGIIPGKLKDQLQATWSDEVDEFPDEIFQTDADTEIEDMSRHWYNVNRLYVEAERCNNGLKDENAWVLIVHGVLNASECFSQDTMLEVNSIQTQQIESTLLPVLPNSSTFAKKADIAIGYSPHHAIVRNKLRRFAAGHADTTLSAMTDAYTSTVPLACAIEVKEAGGDYHEAVTQLGIWSAASLEKMRLLRRGISQETLPPLVGWTVIGHEWKLHICWKNVDGAVMVLGPISQLKTGTGSLEELFSLLALIRRVRLWLCIEFWEWVSQILDS